MSKETVLFQSEEMMNIQDVSGFLINLQISWRVARSFFARVQRNS
jgi:hypothetical protein